VIRVCRVAQLYPTQQMSRLFFFRKPALHEKSLIESGKEKYFSRKGAKAQRKPFRNTVALCAFAPLREKIFSAEVLFVQSPANPSLDRQAQKSLLLNNVFSHFFGLLRCWHSANILPIEIV
jgi:hypothetical protein